MYEFFRLFKSGVWVFNLGTEILRMSHFAKIFRYSDFSQTQFSMKWLVRLLPLKSSTSVCCLSGMFLLYLYRFPTFVGQRHSTKVQHLPEKLFLGCSNSILASTSFWVTSFKVPIHAFVFLKYVLSKFRYFLIWQGILGWSKLNCQKCYLIKGFAIFKFIFRKKTGWITFIKALIGSFFKSAEAA